MKRVLIFSMAYYPRFVGGAEVAIKEITDRLNPAEFEFHMVTLRYDRALPSIERIGNVVVHRIGYTTHKPSIGDLKKFPLVLNKLWYQWGAYRMARKLHKKHGYDAVWAVMAHSGGIPAALFKKAFPAVPYILTLQEGDPTEYIERKMRWFGGLFRAAFARADALTAISTFLAAWGKRMGFRGEPVVIPNGVDVAKFSYQYPSREIEEFKKKLNKKEGDTFLITVSRLVHKNGIDTIIRALPLLPVSVKLLIAGTGPDERKLKSLAKELKVSEQVTFLGEVLHTRLPLYLKSSDIFIRPSRSEGMGNVFIEAFAAGIPVIATQVGGISDFLFDPDKNPDREPTGLAVVPEDYVGIAKQAERLMSDSTLRINLITNASALALNYDWAIVAAKMRDNFLKLK